jgi:homoserine dehydrogenase
MEVRLAISGFGNVGQGLAVLLGRHVGAYRRRYGVQLTLTGVVDRLGGVADTSGLDPQGLLEAKRARGTVAGYPGGEDGLKGRGFLERSRAHVFVEAASTNFVDAEPGWSYVRDALELGIDTVLASKGALALHWSELMNLARRLDRTVLFSATVGAPVPSLQIAERALIGAEILDIEGIVNGTTNQILTAMSRGLSYQEGVRQAQALGIAETDPTLDVDGWDAAAKILILANATLGSALSLDDVRREGIRGVTKAQLEDAAGRGEAIKLIARASRDGSDVVASVKPESRPVNDVLGRLSGDDMGVAFNTVPLGQVASTVHPAGESGGISTAMTVLRDVLNLARDRGWSQAPEG